MEHSFLISATLSDRNTACMGGYGDPSDNTNSVYWLPPGNFISMTGDTDGTPLIAWADTRTWADPNNENRCKIYFRRNP